MLEGEGGGPRRLGPLLHGYRCGRPKQVPKMIMPIISAVDFNCMCEPSDLVSTKSLANYSGVWCRVSISTKNSASRSCCSVFPEARHSSILTFFEQDANGPNYLSKMAPGKGLQLYSTSSFR